MRETRTGNKLGCLYIDEIASGARAASGPSLFMALDGEARRLEDVGPNLWERLQFALQAVRGRCDICGVVARGTGCAAALALSEQLPVDRLVLWTPRLSIPRGVGFGQARRLAAYARRNLALCVSDTMIVDEDRPGGQLAGWSACCRVGRLRLPGGTEDKLYTIREIASKTAVLRFLHTGELPKTLAQNPEMCIIDG